MPTSARVRFMSRSRPNLRAGLTHLALSGLEAGFSANDRDRLGLRGLLPPKAEASSRMVQRVMRQIRALNVDLNKYLVLERIRLTQEQLFYKVLLDNLHELLPIGVLFSILWEGTCWLSGTEGSAAWTCHSVHTDSWRGVPSFRHSCLNGGILGDVVFF